MKRKKQKDLMQIGSILGDSLGSLRTGSDGEMTRIWALWRSIVGDVIAKNSRPAAFKGSLLMINVSSSSWLQHLTFLKAELIQKINTGLGGNMINELKFKIGNVEP